MIGSFLKDAKNKNEEKPERREHAALGFFEDQKKTTPCTSRRTADRAPPQHRVR
jgi:hypothetical protein